MVAVHGLPAAALARLTAAELDAAAGRQLLSVHTAAATAGRPAVLGERRVSGGVLRFRPRLAFRAGLAYRARLDGGLFDRLTGAAPGTTPSLELRFEPQAASAPPTRVEAVYPSAAVLPENLLRLYVWFTAPMGRRQASQGVRLVEVATGEPLELPFVEIPDGLWDPTGRRLTLFLHPGRVKRGVGPRLALGPVLREGREYRLEVDRSLRDARGRQLAAGHSQSFTVGPPDSGSPRPEAWRLRPPAAPTGALSVELAEPLDHGLLLRLLTVVDERGEGVAGEVAISGGETRWVFRPRNPWPPGRYRLRVSTALEDLAGNTPWRLFDEATEGPRRPRPPDRRWIELPFEVADGS